ncbi:MAG: hypothetical protein JW818_01680 [Pirellulales bacterium]|nr:hypothetical protein [Pirellulales bacterium]
MRDPQETDARLERTDVGGRRVWAGMILVAVLVIALPCVYFGTKFYRYYRHSRVSDRMKAAITRLAFYRPDDLTDDQWAHCIFWTWNLHGNYGVVPDFIPTADLERMVTEFEAKIDEGPNRATIDWLWDEYYRSAPNAHNYEQFRPTLPNNLADLEAGVYDDDYSLSWWRSEHERLTGKE